MCVEYPSEMLIHSGAVLDFLHSSCPRFLSSLPMLFQSAVSAHLLACTSSSTLFHNSRYFPFTSIYTSFLPSCPHFLSAHPVLCPADAATAGVQVACNQQCSSQRRRAQPLPGYQAESVAQSHSAVCCISQAYQACRQRSHCQDSGPSQQAI